MAAVRGKHQSLDGIGTWVCGGWAHSGESARAAFKEDWLLILRAQEGSCGVWQLVYFRKSGTNTTKWWQSVWLHQHCEERGLKNVRKDEHADSWSDQMHVIPYTFLWLLCQLKHVFDIWNRVATTHHKVQDTWPLDPPVAASQVLGSLYALPGWVLCNTRDSMWQKITLRTEL